MVEIKDIFQKHLKPSNSTVTNQSAAIDVISKFEKDLEKLENVIKNNNGSPAELMQLIHLQIHPSLQTGFRLQTNMDKDGQMNMG